MTHEFSLEGRVAIVTGAVGLLGREHCRALARAGARVVVVDLDEAECVRFAASLDGAFGAALDVEDRASIERLHERVMTRYGRIDVLVNNAAIDDKFDPKRSLESLEASRFENY